MSGKKENSAGLFRRDVWMVTDAIRGTYSAFTKTATVDQIGRVKALMRLSLQLGKLIERYEIGAF